MNLSSASHTFSHKLCGWCKDVETILVPLSEGTGIKASPLVEKTLKIAGLKNFITFPESSKTLLLGFL